jgi:hypothetical protein
MMQTFLTGVGAGALVVGILWLTVDATHKFRARRAIAHLRDALEGVWVEYIPDSEGRRISIGRIYFDDQKKTFQFDGTNYHDDLRPYCYWQTVASIFDHHELKLYYTFKAQVVNQLDKTYYGFGWVCMGRDGGHFNVDDGHYVSANIDGRPMTHSMNRPPVLQASYSWRKVYSQDEMRTILKLCGLSDKIPEPLRRAG